MSSKMKGKAGLVTGAASGIGRACAVALAAEGAHVVIADLASAQDGARETLRLVEEAGGSGALQVCDVTRPEDHDALCAAVLAHHGALDFACNNAGIGGHGLLADTDVALFDRIIAVNLRGTFLGMRSQIRAMLGHGGGAIVNTASNAGLRGVREIGAYVASKHGIVGLTKNGALEYGDAGIRVNAVCPGVIEAGLTEDVSQERKQELMAPHAIKRLGLPTEVAAAALWLCSDDSSFVTGVALPVDAGSIAGW
ncbi:SDR family NAD(P)-dependent oxidoreductase [Conexibacter sp. CPCC 206217]|uniref:SDR family NAD(P)-dependent oxidoreductase n=1 Tax=Conexibacter sp. CPCC 206217 TaxID=3064574 RepID=UPI00271C30F4|nr:glucose 1-dehydrogenase [Conexibacter sp. CPCC 206217]MDO8213145.1 glucose 1-dehydrogenase [Conexibacter sp. CPCC 206217]